MLSRLGIYFRERFPLTVNIPFTLATYLGLTVATQALFGQEAILINHMTIIGFVTVLGMLLLMRIFDEFKDLETDKVLFPERPIQRGAVKLSDIRWVGIVTAAVMATCNITLGWVIWTFLAMMIFGLLSYKWFFYKERISKDLIMALITHQPFALFMNVYIVSISMYIIDVQHVDLQLIIPIIIFFLPFTAWETSRKIRAEGQETDYVTYSKLLGPRRATLIPLLSLVIALGLTLWLGIVLQFDLWYFILIGVLLIIVGWYHIRFMIHPISSNNTLHKISGVVCTLVFSIFLLAAAANYPWIFQL